MYLIKRDDIKKIAHALEEKYTLYGPYLDEVYGQCIFDTVNGDTVNVNAPITTKPPKQVVFPHL